MTQKPNINHSSHKSSKIPCNHFKHTISTFFELLAPQVPPSLLKYLLSFHDIFWGLFCFNPPPPPLQGPPITIYKLLYSTSAWGGRKNYMPTKLGESE